MNWIEAQIKTVKDSIAWHRDRGLHCEHLERELDILLKKLKYEE